MAKSSRSKRQIRLRSSKRELYKQQVLNPQISQLHQSISLSLKGLQHQPPQKPNAFLYPDHPDAVFPQHTPQRIIDYRSDKNPYSGNEFVGGGRKEFPKHIMGVKEETGRERTVQRKSDDPKLVGQLIQKRITPNMFRRGREVRLVKRKKRYRKWRGKKRKGSKRLY